MDATTVEAIVSLPLLRELVVKDDASVQQLVCGAPAPLCARLTALELCGRYYMHLEGSVATAFTKHLRAFRSLRSFTLSDTIRITTVSFVNAMRLLEHLNLPGVSNVSLKPFSACTRLRSLAVGLVDGDLSPLATLVQLRRLKASGVNSLQPLINLEQMEGLDVYGDSTDLSPLANMTRLRGLILWLEAVSCVQVLTNLRGSLEVLIMRDSNVADLQPLGSLTNLTDLCVEDFDEVATDWSFLEHLTALEGLDRRGIRDGSVAVMCAMLPSSRT